MPSHLTAEQQWVHRWTAAGAALREVRARELRSMSDADVLRAVEDLLDLAHPDAAPLRRPWSGLIELQRQLHRRRL